MSLHIRSIQNLTIMHYTFQHSPLMQYWDRVDKREERESKRVLLLIDTTKDENFYIL